MQVILKVDIPNLGKMGEIVNVKPGYARNYLLPKNLAIIADEKNMKQLEHEKRIIEIRKKKLERQKEVLLEKLNNLELIIRKPVGEHEKLYGSVTAKDILEALKEEGITELTKKNILLEEPIKQLGIYKVKIKLDAGKTVELKVWIVAEGPSKKDNG